jgi:hypothetical protein
MLTLFLVHCMFLSLAIITRTAVVPCCSSGLGPCSCCCHATRNTVTLECSLSLYCRRKRNVGLLADPRPHVSVEGRCSGPVSTDNRREYRLNCGYRTLLFRGGHGCGLSEGSLRRVWNVHSAPASASRPGTECTRGPTAGLTAKFAPEISADFRLRR